MPTTNSFKPNRPSALAAAIAMALPVSVNAAVARIDFAIGQVTATDAGGTEREIKKGDALENGDTISTKRGRAQLRFTDGGFVSLKPQTDFRIDEYAFSGEEDGKERAFMSLLKGGFRTLSGLIGRANKNAYKVETPIATIGIRGTGYEAVLENPLIVRVSKGRACIGLVCASPGQRIRMEKGQPPVVEVQTGQKSEEEVTPAPTEEYKYESGEECAKGSDSCTPDVLVEPVVEVEFGADPECTSFNCAVGAIYPGSAEVPPNEAPVLAVSHDELNVVFTNPATSFSDSEGNELTSGSIMQVEGASFDKVASWYRWVGGTTTGFIPESQDGSQLGPFNVTGGGELQSVHGYVVDLATEGELAAAGSGGLEIKYELPGSLSASPPTLVDGSAEGRLLDATFTINFLSGDVQALVKVFMEDVTYIGDFSRLRALDGPGFSISDDGFNTTSDPTPSCAESGSCETSVVGDVGKGLGHVGFSYEVRRPGPAIIGSGVSVETARKVNPPLNGF